MTKKEFVARFDSAFSCGSRLALQLAEEAGATFDPEPDWADEAAQSFVAWLGHGKPFTTSDLAKVIRKEAPKLPSIEQVMAKIGEYSRRNELPDLGLGAAYGGDIVSGLRELGFISEHAVRRA